MNAHGQIYLHNAQTGTEIDHSDEGAVKMVVSQLPLDCRKPLRCSVYGTVRIVLDAQKVRAFAEAVLGRHQTKKLIHDIMSACQDELDHREWLRTGRSAS